MYNKVMSAINVIGASCIDLLVSDVDREKFFSGTFKAPSIKTSFGGDAFNEAIVLKKLGRDVSLKTIAGNDVYGHMIREHLFNNGVDFDQDILKDGIDTYLSIILMEKDGQHTFVGSENGSLRLLDLDHIRIDEDCRIASFASLFISKVMDEKKYEILFRNIKEKGIILCADSSSPKNDRQIENTDYMKYIDYFFCNENEAMKLCRSDDIFECESLLYQKGIRNVIIKLGDQGCLYQGEIMKPERKVVCVDSTGAGDSFAAGFISSLDQGNEISECIRFANECGARACEYIGATAWLEHL